MLRNLNISTLRLRPATKSRRDGTLFSMENTMYVSSLRGFGEVGTDKNSKISPFGRNDKFQIPHCVRDDRRREVLGESGRRDGAAALTTTLLFLKRRRVIPNAERNLYLNCGNVIPNAVRNLIICFTSLN